MKSLIIYFSHTGENYMSDGIRNITKGNTKIVASYIKEITNGDVFEISSIKEYPYNYKECCAQALKEQEESIHPELKEYLTDIEDYDKIFIGGPIWYNTYPMAIFSLLERLDFKNKTIYPFSTHEGSGVGNIKNDLNKYLKGAIIKSPLAIRGSDVKNSKKIIENWINS